uniref:Uncharacterized protein n=1 Tax=Fagus sylvatica TaxID=28930 RepID=A0A2N9FWV2_FAGSY
MSDETVTNSIEISREEERGHLIEAGELSLWLCCLPSVQTPHQEAPADSNSEESEASPRFQTPEQHSEGETLAEDPLISRGWSIFRVPVHVREVDEGAYNPKIVSIGPFHRDEPGLRAMEAQKLRFLNRLRKRISLLNGAVNLENLENAMEVLEKKTRECYSEHFENINSNDFVQMMVRDGCFIVELLRLYRKKYKGRDVKEPIFETRWMLPTIARDLLMLENQLPIPGKDKLTTDILINTEGECPHLLALFQSTFNPSDSRLPTVRWKTWNQYDRLPGKGWVYNAKTLRDHGVQFVQKSGNLLDIEFKDKILKIPTLFIDDGTSPVLRNLIAYEQSNRYAAPYFSCLAVFLDSIVDTPDNIDILCNAGIIKQVKGGNKELVNFLNSLNKELEFDPEDCTITTQIVDINNYCTSWKAKIIKILRSNTDFTRIALTYLSIVQTVISSSNFTSDNSQVVSPSPSPSPS